MSSHRLSLELTGLAVGHKGKAVLAAIDLVLHPGETVAILGENGSGKSTLLRTLAGFLPPIEGRIILDGTEVTGWDTLGMSRAGLKMSSGIIWIGQKRKPIGRRSTTNGNRTTGRMKSSLKNMVIHLRDSFGKTFSSQMGPR